METGPASIAAAVQTSTSIQFFSRRGQRGYIGVVVCCSSIDGSSVGRGAVEEENLPLAYLAAIW